MSSTALNHRSSSRSLIRISRQGGRQVTIRIPAVWSGQLALADGDELTLAYAGREPSHLLIVPAAELEVAGQPIKLSKSGADTLTLVVGHLFVRAMFLTRECQEYVPSSVFIHCSPDDEKAIAFHWPGLMVYLNQFARLHPTGQERSLRIPRWH
jgi:antitoxin component of MazEF toxin-antitoxin module